jgi:hypothetical protein
MIRHAPSVVPGLCICGQRHSDPEPAAVARSTDPQTSWEAARSVSHIRESQNEVLRLFQSRGPMTDEQARGYYTGKQSLSGFRTRRSELVAQGRLVDTGRRLKGTTGRRMIVWGVPE